MMMEGEVVYANRNGLVMNGEEIRARDRHLDWQFQGRDSGTQHLDVVRGNCRSYEEEVKNGQTRKLSNLNDNASTKFQWRNLLTESRNSGGSGSANHIRNYAGLTEESVPGEGERLRYLHTCAQGDGIPESRGRIRNLSGIRPEEMQTVGEYPPPRLDRDILRQPSNLSGFPPEDSQKGPVREYSPPHLDRDISRKPSNLRGFPPEDSQKRPVREYPPPHLDRDISRKPSSLSGFPLEDSHKRPVREYPPPHLERDISRKPYEEGSSRLRFYSEDSPHSLTPRSQSGGQHTPFNPKENLHQEAWCHPADGFGTSVRVQDLRRDSYHQILYSEASEKLHPFSNGGPEFSPDLRRRGGYIHEESQRSRKVYSRASPEKNYTNEDYNEQQHMLRNNDMDSTLLRNSYIGNTLRSVLMKDEPPNFSNSLPEELNQDDHDVSRYGNELAYDEVTLVSPNAYVEYENAAIASNMILPHEEEFAYEVYDHGLLYDEQKGYVPGLEERISIDENEHPCFESEHLFLYDQSDRILKRKHEYVEKRGKSKRRTSTFGGRGALSYDNRQLSAEHEKEIAPQFRSFSYHGKPEKRANLRVCKTERSPFGGLSEALQSRLSQPHEFSGVDIKKRLKHSQVVPHPWVHPPPKSWRKNAKSLTKPHPQVIHTSASQPHGNTKITSFKTRSKLAPQTVFVPLDGQDPQVARNGASIEKQKKKSTENSGSTKEACHTQEVDPYNSKPKVRPTEKDLPEDCEEFKKQVDEWFLRAMHHLNTNPGRQKKFKEQGKAGTLECFICSSSTEFRETKDVAMHAFSSLKVGLRARHLGFHRALCVLMGWDTAVGPNGRWVCQSLPDVEALALKEDVIVWPPVVVVHRSCAGNCNGNEQVKISIEQLENVLRDMGIGDGKGKVSHGKPGNPNILVVKFSGTLSGLQEAEKLHNLFAEKKHGRAELQEVQAGGVCCSEDPVSQLPEDKIEDTLYGYLGLIEDLDKLHYDMKKHCCAKSKKDILAIADAGT